MICGGFLKQLIQLFSPSMQNWLELLPGKWRLLYSTGRHIGLTLRQPPSRVLITDAHLIVSRPSKKNTNLSFTSNIRFAVLTGKEWPHNKSGVNGKLQTKSTFKLKAGRRLYLKEENGTESFQSAARNAQKAVIKTMSSKKWKKVIPYREFPSSLSVAKLISSEVDVSMSLEEPLSGDVEIAQQVVHEVRTQVPPEMFDVSEIVCGTYVDSRLLVLRSVDGSALLFTRSCK